MSKKTPTEKTTVFEIWIDDKHFGDTEQYGDRGSIEIFGSLKLIPTLRVKVDKNGYYVPDAQLNMPASVNGKFIVVDDDTIVYRKPRKE